MSSNCRFSYFSSLIAPRVLEYQITQSAQPFVHRSSTARWLHARGHFSSLWGLIVGFSFDPAARVATENISTTLVVDENGQTEWHRCQPPRPPKHNTYQVILPVIRYNANMSICQNNFGDCFPVLCGVRQDGVLSPYLFALYIDDLLGSLRLSGYGLYIGHLFVGCLL